MFNWFLGKRLEMLLNSLQYTGPLPTKEVLYIQINVVFESMN